jgi:hypothetical protein
LLYWTSEKQVLENKYLEEQKKKQEIKQKVNSGNMKMYFKPNLDKKFKDELLGIKE